MPRQKSSNEPKGSKNKMSKNSLKEKFPVDLIKLAITSVTGLGTEKIVDLLLGKKNVNEFDISQKFGGTINQTRNILYKLTDEGLVSFIRKKDKKNGGWYTYFWTLNVARALDNLRVILEKKIDEINRELAIRKEGRIYHCEICNLEYNEESALLNSFSCPECGSVMILKDNTQIISKLTLEVEKSKRDLERISQEIGTFQKKEDVIMVRKQKVQDRKIKAKRKKKREETKRIKEKLNQGAKKSEKSNKGGREKKSIKRALKKSKKKKIRILL